MNARQSEFPKLTGPYLGQKPPGTTPEIFAPGIVSTTAHEFSCCFMPDGKEFFFARRDLKLNQTVLFVTKLVDGAWTEPSVALFVENEYSFEPSVTPNSQRLYFQSGKPIPGQTGPPMNVLYVEREGERWGMPKNPGPPFNPAQAMGISSTLNGTIYTTDISGGPGSECIAVMRKINGEYQKLERLGPPINKDIQGMYPFVAPDESYLIFSSRKPAEKIDSVLLISYKGSDGRWGEPRLIDVGMSAGLPLVSPDGRFLFFTSGERGKSDIYWVSAKIIERGRGKEVR
jgi:Tol biopolymer transport system component